MVNKVDKLEISVPSSTGLVPERLYNVFKTICCTEKNEKSLKYLQKISVGYRKYPHNQHISGYSPIFFIWFSENISGNTPIYSTVKIPCWSNGRNISGNTPIFFDVFRRGEIFRGLLDIAKLRATFGRLKRSQKIGDVCKML